MQFVAILSGAGTNFGVGHTSGACVEKCFFLLCPPPTFATTYTISRLGERFRDGQYILVS